MSTPTLNRAEFIGRLTRDPELRHTPSGNPVANFGLAINRSFNTDGGERGESTVFIDVQAWDSKARLCDEYLRQGDLVFVDGRIVMDQWHESETGKNRTKLGLVLNNVQFLDTRRSGAAGAENEGAAPAPQRPQRQAEPGTVEGAKKGARSKKSGAGKEA